MLYLSMTKVTPDATKATLDMGFTQRAADAAKTLEAAGGRYVGLYVADGAEWDWIAIAEFPDTWTTATVTTTVFQGMAQGAYQRYKMVPLSTPDSVDAAQPAVTFRNLLDEWSGSDSERDTARAAHSPTLASSHDRGTHDSPVRQRSHGAAGTGRVAECSDAAAHSGASLPSLSS